MENLEKGVHENKINESLKGCNDYLGTFAIDEILNIKIKQYPVHMIINFDKRQDIGSHWIALSLFKNQIYICDSLGGLCYPETFPSELLVFLKTMVYQKDLIISNQLQCLTSGTCGYYCIMFIKFMCKGKNFLSLFNNDCKNNDKLILKMYKRNSLS